MNTIVNFIDNKRFIGALLVANSCVLTAHAEPATSLQQPISLESTFTGDQDQPAVSHFVQWRASQSPDHLRWDLKPKPSDDILKVADRDVVRRRAAIYNDLQLEPLR